MTLADLEKHVLETDLDLLWGAELRLDAMTLAAASRVMREALIKANDELRERCHRDGCERDATWIAYGYENDYEAYCSRHKPGSSIGYRVFEQPEGVKTIRAALAEADRIAGEAK